MIEFPIVKSNRKPRSVMRVGVCDADYKVTSLVNGRLIKCPFYVKWHNMLSRCYCESYQNHRPTYKGCSVCDEWLTFSTFKKWMESQDWEGNHLDKDLLDPGNKIYSPDNCVFVSHAINNLLLDKEASKGPYPKGVSYRKKGGKYQAQISIEGKVTALGRFDTVGEAEQAYRAAKGAEIERLAYLQKDKRVAAALFRAAREHLEPC